MLEGEEGYRRPALRFASSQIEHVLKQFCLSWKLEAESSIRAITP
jgi:hypothetical protein